MKRFVLMFLMLLLPLQFSWAGVSFYCQHETGAAAQHVGHHAHQHQKSPDAGDDGSAPGKAHADCGYCHLAHSCAVVAAVSVPAFSCDAAAIAAQPDTLSSHFSEGPERPKWVRPA
jgi:hypothetical protein